MARTKFSFSVGGPIAAEAVADGTMAERLGYNFVWAADHLTDIRPVTAVFDAWTLLAYVGSKTRRVMLASGVADIQRMHPAKMASTVATLDNLTRGRAVLGIGTGEVMNTAPYGMEWEPVAVRVQRFREYLRVVKLLWSSSKRRPVSFGGEYYKLDTAHLGLPPFKSDPPIYVGAFASDAMLQSTGELADGWFPGIFYTAGAFRDKVSVIREASAGAGRRFADIDVIANVPVIPEADAATLRAIKAKFRRSLVISKQMLKILGADEAYEQVSKELQYQFIAPTAEYEEKLSKVVNSLRISDEILERGIDEMMAVGSTDDCINSLKRFLKAGATHIHVSTYVKNPRALQIISKKIVPHL